MVERNEQKYRAADRHLKESIASGRITAFEADAIKHFFASTPSQNWPSSGLQRRMQSSGDEVALKNNPKS